MSDMGSTGRNEEHRPILDGVRVLDLTQYLAGPTVTRLMAEFGADIVKVEQAPSGDPVRSIMVMRDGRSAYFVQQNRGKKSLCVDFDHPDALDAVRAVAAKADVVVENYGPGVLEKRGLDYASLAEINPRLVMVSISAFGRSGLYAQRTGFDMIAQAFSGIMHVTGAPDGPPVFVGTSIADVTTGVHALTAVGLALFHRERTGRGQYLDISMVDAMFHQHEVAIQGHAMTNGKWRMKRGGAHSLINAPQGAFKSPDGYIVLQVMPRQWLGFCTAIGRPDLATDERFADLKTRPKHARALQEIIEDWMATFDSDDAVLQVLEEHRVPSAKVMDPADAIGHPYFASRAMVRTVPDPILGEVVIPGVPLKFSDQPGHLDLVAPLLGEHNAEVLRDVGYDDERIRALTDAGVLHHGDR